MITRHGRRYVWAYTGHGAHPGTHYASVTMESVTQATLHSSAPLPIPVPKPLSFREALALYGNPSLWADLKVDGDGEWISHGIQLGTLVVAHDGSYMPEDSVDLCSAGVVIYCRDSKNWLRLSLSECSHYASNYRGELLGAVLSLLILRAASSSLPLPSSQLVTTLFCDNRGVISHCNSSLVSLSEKQTQADLIRLAKHLSATNPSRTTWRWVEGHAVERKGWDNCSLSERLNAHADRLAKDSLLRAISGGHIMEGDFPLEPVLLKVSGERVSCSPRQALEWSWGYITARSLYAAKGIIRAEDFPLVWWEGLDAANAQYPTMYKVWLTKHVSDCCGTNVQMYYRSGGTHSPKCDSCGEDEYSCHICQCKAPGREYLYSLSVKELVAWLNSTLGNRCVSTTIETYLRSHGEVGMTDCLHGSCPHLTAAATATDRLGFNNFIEGRISQHWLSVAAPLLRRSRQFLLPPAWGRQFIKELHKIIHKQWIYRNSFIHYQGPDGLTLAEHHDIINRIEEYALTDPDTLLPRHRSLLGVDFGSLGGGSTGNRLTWLANMDSAMSASTLARMGTLSSTAAAHFAAVNVTAPRPPQP